jgi:hypothetical protein
VLCRATPPPHDSLERWQRVGAGGDLADDVRWNSGARPESTSRLSAKWLMKVRRQAAEGSSSHAHVRHRCLRAHRLGLDEERNFAVAAGTTRSGQTTPASV